MRQEMKFAGARHQFERNHILLAGDLIIWLFEETHFGIGAVHRCQKIVQVCSKLHRRGTELLCQPINRDFWLKKNNIQSKLPKTTFSRVSEFKVLQNQADLRYQPISCSLLLGLYGYSGVMIHQDQLNNTSTYYQTLPNIIHSTPKCKSLQNTHFK